MRVGRPTTVQMCFDPRLSLLAAKAQPRGKTKGAGHANRDSLAMHKPSPIVSGECVQTHGRKYGQD